ncbi:MAG: ribonuclease H-like domain-containing protein [candidate division Zixibacteria bacterium]|nr:ribonuclease H-like domain-containing protein [candidate division Zixibacteria bacterium]
MTDRADQLRARLERYAAQFTQEAQAEPSRLIGPDSVGAAEVRSQHGRFWHRRDGYDVKEPWGESLIEEVCARITGRGLRIPFAQPAVRIALRDCLFVDCETTGLSGGAGTVAFLIAVGQFDGECFWVDQYFLPDLGDEASVLHRLSRRFASAAALVTYNGGAFDLPLLEGRFRFWRLEPSFRDLPHLDLLWPTRALFRHRLESCSLGQVEEQLLKFARVEDLPGAEIPQVYFQYLHEGHSPRLHAVFEHNRLDVVSLFVYSLWMDERTQPERPTLADPDDLFALAHFWLNRRMVTLALCALDVASNRVLDPAQRARLCELRARVFKRQQSYGDAHVQWQQVAASMPGRPDVAEEIAKHLEHRQRDYHAALAVVERALRALDFRDSVGDTVEAYVRERLHHRRARLLRRLASSERGRTPSHSGVTSA